MTESHALLASAGNADEVLPPGIVCDPCNYGWGKIERQLNEYPLFKIGAWALHSMNVRTGKPFCPQLKDDRGEIMSLPRGSQGGINLKIRIAEHALRVEVTTETKGIFTAQYTPRTHAFLSRAVHKVAFEALAWGMYTPNVQQGMLIDPLSPHFDDIRAWVKRGQPTRPIRPFLQPGKLSTEVNIPNTTFGPRVFARPDGKQIFVQYRDGFSWYAVALFSSANDATKDLREWAIRTELSGGFLVSDRFSLVKISPPTALR